MHQFDQFKQDMEKMAKSDLPNPIKSKGPRKTEPHEPRCFNKNCYMIYVPDDAYECEHFNHCKLAQREPDEKPIVTNLYQFDGNQVFQHCTVLTIDGVPGFAWYDPATGQRHDEGFTWPTMQIHKDATVEVLFGPDGERSAGWKKES